MCGLSFSAIYHILTDYATDLLLPVWLAGIPSTAEGLLLLHETMSGSS